MELINEMLVFARVVELRSFTAVARQLGLSASAVSRSVARLEAHMGARLLQRTTRAVSPTDLGLEVYAGCAQIARTAREVHAIAGHHAQMPAGRLLVSAPIVFGQRWLTPRLPAFLERWPQVQLQLTLTDRLVDLVEEGFDLALRITGAPAPGLVARPILRTRYAMVAAPAYLQRRGVPATPHDLVRHECVLLGYGAFTGDLVLQRGEERVSVQVDGRLAVNNGAAILASAEAGLGIGLLPDFTAEAALRSGAVERVLPDWSLGAGYAERAVHAVYAPTRHLPLKVRVFIDHLAADAA